MEEHTGIVGTAWHTDTIQSANKLTAMGIKEIRETMHIFLSSQKEIETSSDNIASTINKLPTPAEKTGEMGWDLQNSEAPVTQNISPFLERTANAEYHISTLRF